MFERATFRGNANEQASQVELFNADQFITCLFVIAHGCLPSGESENGRNYSSVVRVEPVRKVTRSSQFRRQSGASNNLMPRYRRERVTSTIISISMHPELRKPCLET